MRSNLSNPWRTAMSHQGRAWNLDSTVLDWSYLEETGNIRPWFFSCPAQGSRKAFVMELHVNHGYFEELFHLYINMPLLWVWVLRSDLGLEISDTNTTKFLPSSQLISLWGRRVHPHSAVWQLLSLLLCRLNRELGIHNCNPTRGNQRS